MSELKARIEAERSGQPFLVYTDGEGRQQLFSFAPGVTEASIGRERSTDIVLGWDAEVSRLHARFERSEEEWTIVDDGLSSNGTFVNEQRISGRVRMTDGDTLRLGATSLDLPAAREAGRGAGRGRGSSRGGPLHHPAPRARGPVPSVPGRRRLACRRRADRRAALPAGRRRQDAPEGAVRQVRRRQGSRRTRSGSALSRPCTAARSRSATYSRARPRLRGRRVRGRAGRGLGRDRVLYHARQMRLDRPVALKVVDAEVAETPLEFASVCAARPGRWRRSTTPTSCRSTRPARRTARCSSPRAGWRAPSWAT